MTAPVAVTIRSAFVVSLVSPEDVTISVPEFAGTDSR